MKTVFIDCSPKKKRSASKFIASFTGVFVKGRKEYLPLHTPSDYDRILEAITDADSVVFSMPLYVDGIPSHILPFLKKMEAFSKENSLKSNVFVISNCGFIEGNQTEPLMQCVENFCLRSGLNWCGGLGIGGGVMMNVMRIMVMTLFGCGIISFDVWLAASINRKRAYGKHYTRVMVPSFVFILFADMFFFLLSLFSGGLFKGWTKS